MAKSYISSTKYMIKISFEVSGAVDKPDIVGAIFGQSEGLLGDELDLKELQKGGKIGRIEISHSNVLGKTKGEIFVPSSMDIVQTSLLAAAIESVDKVGPYDSHFKILNIDDVRTAKRQEIKSRAQELLERFRQNIMPDTTELTESLREVSRTADLVELGAEKLPAGPEAESSSEIIVVEGRADVINLLKNNIKNVVAMNGAQIPQTIIDISMKKEVTVFVDGDRGGKLNARNFLQIAKAAYIAIAPDGKEVEELTRKEIIQSIRKKMPPGEFLSMQENSMDNTRFGPTGPVRRMPPRKPFQRTSRFERPQRRMHEREPRRMDFERTFYSDQQPEQQIQEPQAQVMPSTEEQARFQPIMQEIKNSLKAKLFDENMKEIKETQTKNLFEEINQTKGISTIVFDGIITKRLVDAAEKNGIKCIVGAKKGKIDNTTIKTLVIKN